MLYLWSKGTYGVSKNLNLFLFLISETKRELEKRHVYYEQTCFPRFQYTRNLIEKCKSQVEKNCQKTSSNDTLKCDGMIKITYIGDTPTHLISNGKGNVNKIKCPVRLLTYIYIFNTV